MNVIPFPGKSRVILSKAEFDRLIMLRMKVDASVHPAEVKVYAAEITAIIENASQRPNAHT
ncbi:hypothetical protein [Paenibacillus sp. NEAU-GSW1]|uniref:hypothetical protein n=1 Tax=Paenibacillus sp. NEAU-GSW1 TaxID=2682486 RepID=UPI0012E20A8B|nr:hypothetical protein [Paenibacillus sp. NEAU-GSW1]MUT66615.1 hypothetical protein [Paenibacillus sp. NEAU-GSW1]